MNHFSFTKRLFKEYAFSLIELLAVSTTIKKINKEKVRKILIAESGGVGDLLRVFPVIGSLKHNFPDAHLTLLANPVSPETLKLFPQKEIINNIIYYDPKKTHKGIYRKLPLILTLRNKNFDLVYYPRRGEGTREENIINYFTGAKCKIGFEFDKTGKMNTFKIKFRHDIPIHKQNLELLKSAGLEVLNENVDISIPPKDIQFADKLISQSNFNLSNPIISIHVGAAWNAKYRCWPIEKFIELIKNITHNDEANVIIIGGANDVKAAEIIKQNVPKDSIVSVAGETSICQMAAVIGKSQFFIGNDSGPLHIASTLGIPFIGLFGPTDPEQVLGFFDKGIAVKNNLPCSPCYMHEPVFSPICRNQEPVPCMDAILVSDVLSIIETQLFNRLNSTRKCNT